MEPPWLARQDKQLSTKNNRLQDFINPREMGIAAVVMAVVSFFLLGSGLSLMAFVLGSFGVYAAVKKKAGVKIILLNVLALMLGFAGNVSLSIMMDQRRRASAPVPAPVANLTPLPTPRPVSPPPAPLLASNTPPHSISSERVIQMNALMKKNGESLEGLQAYSFRKDEEGLTHIDFSAYVNGVYAEETIYHFGVGGTLSSISNEFDASAYAHISTVPRISESQAIEIAGGKTKMSSLVATKAFRNKNRGIREEKDIVLVWNVHPDNNSFPLVVVDAETGGIIYYDTGVRY